MTTLGGQEDSLYFAYGFNMARAHLQERCPEAEPVGVAVLEGHALVFAGRSRTWGAGVATVMPQPSSLVPGVLYRVPSLALDRLDRFEGVPRHYVRQTVSVVHGEQAQEAMLYVRPQPEVLAPSSRYYDALRTAYHEYALPLERLEDALAMAALQTRLRTDGRLLFVYGTLRAGQANHRLLERSPFLGPARTAVRYALSQWREYPALRENGSASIPGELYWVDAKSLEEIDVFEGHPLLYRRQAVLLEDGSSAEAYFIARE